MRTFIEPRRPRRPATNPKGRRPRPAVAVVLTGRSDEIGALKEASERARDDGAELAVILCSRSRLVRLSGLAGWDPRRLTAEAEAVTAGRLIGMLELVAVTGHVEVLGTVASVSSAATLAASRGCLALVGPTPLRPRGSHRFKDRRNVIRSCDPELAAGIPLPRLRPRPRPRPSTASRHHASRLAVRP